MDKIVYDGWVKVLKREYKGKDYDVLELYDAVAAIIEDKLGNFLFVKQYRVPLERDTLEIPAGCLDKNSLSPLDVMIEELMEEATLQVDQKKLIPLLKGYPHVGTSSQSVLIYYGKFDGVGANKTIFDDDVTEILWLSREEIEEMISSEEIIDFKTQLAYFYYKNSKHNTRNI